MRVPKSGVQVHLSARRNDDGEVELVRHDGHVLAVASPAAARQLAESLYDAATVGSWAALTTARLAVLRAAADLHPEGEAAPTLQAIADRIGRSKSSVSETVCKLKDLGLIEEGRPREVGIVLTAAGRLAAQRRT